MLIAGSSDDMLVGLAVIVFCNGGLLSWCSTTVLTVTPSKKSRTSFVREEFPFFVGAFSYSMGKGLKTTVI